jgi:hypothetical protein
MAAYDTAEGDEKSLAMLRAQFQQYASAKDREIEEWRLAHRYYSGKQLTEKEITTYQKRKQPVIIFNRVSRKIDGVVGVVRKLRTDPKAFPQRQDQGQAAELATQIVRYVCDASEFEGIESDAVLAASVIGLGGIELGLRDAPEGDQEVELIDFDARTFFYDPRSFKADFSDARYMGTYKWASIDEIEEIAPGKAAEVEGAGDGGFSTQADTDRDDKWRDDKGRVRLVDHWYIQGGKWQWCLHAGTVKIASGESPFYDENGRSICKFRVFSAYIDDEGDRYGFVRNMKGPQDAMNQHRSKAMHIMNTRQIIARRGAFADIEKARREAARPDGVIEFDGSADDFRIDQPSQEFIQQTQYFQDAKDEIENFGPNQALLGTNMSASSGRAIAMMQQSGLAELGPFLKNLRMWKLDLYRAIWTNSKRYMTAEKMIRLTGDAQAAQFIEVNKLQIDEYGQPVIVNQLGAIDVDIRMEEGPDTETVMGDVFDTLTALANNQTPVPPQVLIKMSSLPSSVKDELMKMLDPSQQPPPPGAEMQMQAQQMEMQAQQIEMAGKQADVQGKQLATEKAAVELERAKVELQKAMVPQDMQAPVPMIMEPDPMVEDQREFMKARAMKELDFEFETRRKKLERNANQSSALGMGDDGADSDELGPSPVDLLMQAIMRQGEAIQAGLSQVGAGMSDVGAGMQILAQAQNAPKRIVRGSDGRAAGIEMVN